MTIGAVRQAIGPLKHQLKVFYDEASQLVSQHFYSDTDSTIDRNELELRIEELDVKMQRRISTLKEKDKEYRELLERREAQSVASEVMEKEEEKYGLTAWAQDGYMTICQEAEDLMDTIRRRLPSATSVPRAESQGSLHTTTTSVQPNRQDDSPVGNVTFTGARDKDAQQSSGSQSSHSAPGIRLPKLDLPKFDGNPENWTEFWDLFSVMVDQQNNSTVQKLGYLKCSLTDKAKSIVKGMLTSEVHYKEAIDMLKKRFGNVEYTKNGLYKNLREIKASSNQVADLRRCVDEVQVTMRQLKAFGEDTTHSSFLSLIQDKLINYVKTELESRRHKYLDWNAEVYVQELEDFLQIRENLCKPVPSQAEWSPMRFREPSSGTSFASFHTPRRFKNCVFCDGEHYNDECTQFVSQPARWKRLLERKLCKRCLGSGHTGRDCRKADKPCYHCKMSDHNAALCRNRTANQMRYEQDQRDVPRYGHPGTRAHPTVRTGQNNIPRLHSAGVQPSNAVLPQFSGSTSADQLDPRQGVYYGNTPAVVLQVGQVTVENPITGSRAVARVFFDSGSTKTFVSTQFAQRFGLLMQPANAMVIDTFFAQAPKVVEASETEMLFILRDGSKLPVRSSVIPPFINDIVLERLTSEDRNVLSQIPDVHLAYRPPDSREPFRPDILVGLDYFWQILYLPGESLPDYVPRPQRLSSGLYLLPSRIGLILGGPGSVERAINESVQVHKCSLSIENGNRFQHNHNHGVEELWELERIGISDSIYDNDDERAKAHFDKTVAFDGERYVVGFPWIQERKDRLKDNYAVALRRFKGQHRRLEDNIRLACDEIICDQEKKGIIEKVPEAEEYGKSGIKHMLHYLPHRPVVDMKRATTKVRIVYDASARASKADYSLNDCMYRGPLLLPSLCGVLIRARTMKIILISDVEKAFLQLRLIESDKDISRFFWYKDVKQPSANLADIQEYRFRAVLFGARASPSLLDQTLHYHLNRALSERIRKLGRNLYVDNSIAGAETKSEAVKLYQEAKQEFAKAGMNLREFMSNDQEVRDEIPEKDRMRSVEAKILGIRWNADKDTLRVPQVKTSSSEVMTKRTLLRAVAGVFDPMGFFSPVTIQGRQIMQEVWKKGVNWDDELKFEKSERWNQYLNDVATLHRLEFSRFLDVQNDDSHQLVGFCDASRKAFAAVVYLVTTSTDGQRKSQLVFSRSRLCPKTCSKGKITIPRLELLGILTAVRAVRFVKGEIDVPISDCWICSDSTIAIHWIFTKATLSVFVQNRVNEVRKATDLKIRHVKGEDNPADVASRGSSLEAMHQSSWWKGPVWLSKSNEEWQVTEVAETLVEDEEEFEKETTVTIANKVTTTSVTQSTDVRQGPFFVMIDAEKIYDKIRPTKLISLLRTTVYVMRFVKILTREREIKAETKSVLKKIRADGPIDATELNEARKIWEKDVQSYAMTATGKNISATERNLRLFVDKDGIIRCRGRFGNIGDEVQPKLLPRKHPFTSLVIMDYHRQLKHASTTHTLAALRTSYWVTKGRAEVRSVLNQCRYCRRYQSLPFQLPSFPPLPMERIESGHQVFKYVGVDMFGPIMIKSDRKGDEVIKVWICLYTCLQVRAVHLETVPGLATTDIINCFKRIFARRGKPSKIYSDNAASFKLTEKIIGSNVNEFVSNQGVLWKFTIELSPWQGGIFERMVGIVKRTLRKFLGLRRWTYEELNTMVIETEAIVNTRPLTYVSSDPDQFTALTPALFLTGSNTLTMELPKTGEEYDTDSDYLEELDTRAKVIAQMRKQERRMHQVWEVWKSQYLQMLRQRQDSTHRQGRLVTQRKPSIGEVVILHDSELPRSQWTLARIIETLDSDDGACRAVKVKRADGRVLRRPVNLVYPMEVYSDPSLDEGTKQEEQGPEKLQRPTRKAAKRAMEKIRQNEQSDEDDY